MNRSSWCSPRIEIQAHRGGRGLMPENTLAAFAHALGIGVSTLEFDVGVSADGVVVAYHDREINPDITRDSNGQWLSEKGSSLFASSFYELTTYDVGRLKPGTQYALDHPEQRPADGEAIPCMEEIIDLTRELGAEQVGLNAEIKLSPLEPDTTLDFEAFTDAVLDALNDAAVAPRSAIQAFDWRPLQHVQQMAPQIPTGYLTCQQPFFDTVSGDPGAASPWHAGYKLSAHAGSLPAMVKAAGGAYWCPHFRDLDAQQLEQAHALGLEVKVWTVNDTDDARRLIAMGVDAIITDYPDRIRGVMEELGLPVPDPVPRQSLKPP